jgi:uncharacterized protein (TIGR03067 family)
MIRLALFAVLALALTASAQDKKDVPKDLVPFQGTWKVVRVESGGKPVEKDPEGVRFKFEGDKLTVTETRKKKDESMTVSVDPKQDPAAIDINDPRAGKIPGIYKFDKDGKLNLCVSGGKGGDRPKSFDTTGVKARLFVLEKVKE